MIRNRPIWPKIEGGMSWSVLIVILGRKSHANKVRDRTTYLMKHPVWRTGTMRTVNDMRIDDASKLAYSSTTNPTKRSSTSNASTVESQSVAAPSESADNQSRAERIASLKQQFAAGQPIDVNKLASTLAQSGVLFDEKA